MRNETRPFHIYKHHQFGWLYIRNRKHPATDGDLDAVIIFCMQMDKRS
jgi:hypothetical protein